MDSDVRDSVVGDPIVRPNQEETLRHHHGTAGFDSKLHRRATLFRSPS
jgi:hypothetical protein